MNTEDEIKTTELRINELYKILKNAHEEREFLKHELIKLKKQRTRYSRDEGLCLSQEDNKLIDDLIFSLNQSKLGEAKYHEARCEIMHFLKEQLLYFGITAQGDNKEGIKSIVKYWLDRVPNRIIKKIIIEEKEKLIIKNNLTFIKSSQVNKKLNNVFCRDISNLINEYIEPVGYCVISDESKIKIHNYICENILITKSQYVWLLKTKTNRTTGYAVYYQLRRDLIKLYFPYFNRTIAKYEYTKNKTKKEQDGHLFIKALNHVIRDSLYNMIKVIHSNHEEALEIIEDKIGLNLMYGLKL